MTEKSQKRKLSIKNKEKNNIIAQWGIPLVLLLVVVIVLVSNFSIISRTSAKETISTKMIEDCESYASTINNSLTCMTYAGQSAAAFIGENEKRDTATWVQYASLLKQSIPSPYLVAVVDMKGKGVNSENLSIDLSQQSYYIETCVQKYIYTEDDGFMGNKAFISVIPIYRERTVIGMIYMYASAESILENVSLKEYDGYTAYALIDETGRLMVTDGSESYFTSGSNFIDNLRTASCTDMSFSKATMYLGKLNKFTFMVKKGDESKTIVAVPVKIGEWILVTVLNQQYIDTAQLSEWASARTMVRNLVLAAVAFLCLIIVISIINKHRFNEENHDLANKADTDLLTELNNKIATERKIQEFIDENPDAQCLMFLFDIDNFKKINDTMGHAFGDEVLRSLGLQLRNEFRVTDIIGRTGGDEFILFLKYIKSDEQLELEGERLSNFFHQFKAGEYVKYSATASVGAVVYPRDAKDFESLYKLADTALYEAKRRGKNQVVFYNSDLKETDKRKEVPIDSDR